MKHDATARAIPAPEAVFDEEGEFLGYKIEPPFIRREHGCDESDREAVFTAADRLKGRIFKFEEVSESEKRGIYRLEAVAGSVDPRNGYPPYCVELIFRLCESLDEDQLRIECWKPSMLS